MCRPVVYQITFEINPCKNYGSIIYQKPVFLKSRDKKIIIYYDSNTSTLHINVIYWLMQYMSKQNKTKTNWLVLNIAFYNLVVSTINLVKNIY